MTQLNPPDFAQLVDWIEGRLDPNEAERVARWVESADAETRATVAWIRAFEQSRRFGALATPSAKAKAQALAALAQARQPQPAGFLRRLVAALAPTPNARLAGGTRAGARSATLKAGHRRINYVVEGWEIVLEVDPRRQDGRFDLAGQVFADEDLAEIAVQLIQVDDGAERGATVTDELGEFVFEAIPAAIYSVILRTPNSEIELPDVRLTM